MVRVGADFSEARRGLQGATRELNRFKRDTDRTVRGITGRTGLGKIGAEFTDARKSIVSALSQIRGAKGVGGVASALGSLRPALSSAAAGFRGLGAAAGGAAAALGPIGIGLGVLTAALAAATVGIYQASQAAVQYEADLGRLQMQLKGNTREFVDWARSLGLARTSAVQMGATYSTLLSSFIRDNDELTESTKQLLQTTRVVASATGRSIDDVMERMRSGKQHAA
jgi:hypothetical protein